MMLDLIRTGEATTRGELANATGLSRSTVATRVEHLLAEGLIAEVGEAPSSGGRPPALLGFNQEAGVVLAVDLGATHARVAITDLGATPIAERALDLDIASGPENVLGTVDRVLISLLDANGHVPDEVKGIGIGVPGPVEYAAGRAVTPPIMPGWDGYPIRDRFVDRYHVPVLVDNDVNIMARGEHWVTAEPSDDFLFVKVGTGIGSGLILGGRLHRGALGAAGDMGHIQTPTAEGIVCRCGNTGCLESVAGGRALAERLDAPDTRAVVSMVKAGNRDAIQAVREAGRLIGQVLASTVNLLNPGTIVVGGDLADAGDQLFAGIREVVYRRSTALATSRLQLIPSILGDRAGVTGAAAMVIDHVLSPKRVDRTLSLATGGVR